MNWLPLLEIGMSVLILAPLFSAARILRKLDQLAKQRKQPTTIWIVDLLCLIFMVQLPLVAFSQFGSTSIDWFIPLGLSLLMALVWWTTVKTVSAGGIVSFKWRSLISLFVIPMTYIGSFALSIICINAMMGNFGENLKVGVGTGALLGLICGLLISNWIVDKSVAE